MDGNDKIDRRELLVKAAGVAGGATALTGAALTPAHGQATPPPGFKDQQPLKDYWEKQLRDIVNVDLTKDAPELAHEAIKERHRIYCHLLMKLIHRFWNGNKRGPFGEYPLRNKQLESQDAPPRRYRGDMIANPGGSRVNWDRYVGHNIACIAVDGNGEVIDFDFNHNDFFRSSAEHAESRMVRRLFGLTNIFDSWKTGYPVNDDSPIRDKPAQLNEVTLYTSLESCAQCSGVMSLAGVKQIVYLQHDFTAYLIGNIMYNLANRSPSDKPGAPTPIPASEIGLVQFGKLNTANLKFAEKIEAAEKQYKAAVKEKNDEEIKKALREAFFVPPGGGRPDFSSIITSFLCTDAAHDIFADGGKMLDTMQTAFPEHRFPNQVDGKNHKDILTNAQCLKEAREFFRYADIEGYRGSPHKL